MAVAFLFPKGWLWGTCCNSTKLLVNLYIIHLKKTTGFSHHSLVYPILCEFTSVRTCKTSNPKPLWNQTYVKMSHLDLTKWYKDLSRTIEWSPFSLKGTSKTHQLFQKLHSFVVLKDKGYSILTNDIKSGNLFATTLWYLQARVPMSYGTQQWYCNSLNCMKMLNNANKQMKYLKTNFKTQSK